MTWVKELEKEKTEFTLAQWKVRKNFAFKMKENFSALKYASQNEWALLRAMVDMECLEEEINTVEETFFGIDIQDYDGKVSIDEIMDVAKESGLFADIEGRTTRTPME